MSEQKIYNERRNVAGAYGARRLGGTAVVAVAALLAGTVSAQGQSFFDWFGNSGNANFVNAVNHVTDSNWESVRDQLAGKPAGERAVVVRNTLTAGLQLFNEVAVDVVFADMEFLSSTTKFKNLATAVSGSSMSSDAQVGNWQMFPVFPDQTRPNSLHGSVEVTGYLLSGASMANESLYPGSPNLRNPANGNSSAPNIRSAFFTLPIARLSLTSDNLNGFPANHTHVPYVARFNNFGNNALNNSSDDEFPFKWTTTSPGPNGEDYTDQLLSRGDFAALVAHYRARGADSLITFEPGVVGYTQAQMENDVQVGWSLFDVVDASGAGGAQVATTRDTVSVNGQTQSIEDSGVVWSGMWNDDVLHVLLSNLSDKDAEVGFDSTVDSAFFLPADQYQVTAGQHLFIELFRAKINGVDFWLRARADDLAGGSLGLDFDRNGMGIPEPASLILMGIGSLAVLARRRH